MAILAYVQTGAERLAYGDGVLSRHETETVREIAASDGVSVEYVAKAMWLAKSYRPRERAKLGPQLLSVLAASHLEVAAKLEPTVRETLLRRAVDERMSVRDLRRLARQRQIASTTTSGGATDLTSARRALEHYVDWPDADLARLIAGPNGSTIRALAQAGQALALRLEGRPPENCA